MKRIEQDYPMMVPTKEVWRALTDPDMISGWGAGPAKMGEKLEDFSLWGGDIYGKNTKVIIGKLIEQDWFSKDWKEPSKVVIALIDDGGSTQISLIHDNIPEESYESIKSGWNDYYFGPMKKFLEEGR